MTRFFAWFLIGIAALRLAGGDLLMLQVTAWSSMLVTRTAESGITEAVKTTFDGDHPCKMCHVVKEASKAVDAQKEKDGQGEGTGAGSNSNSPSKVPTEFFKLNKDFPQFAGAPLPDSPAALLTGGAKMETLWRNVFAGGRHDAPVWQPPKC